MLIVQMLNEAWISIKSNKLRSFLTILGIVIGVCAVVLMVATGQTVRNEINKELESLGGNKLIIMPARINRGGISGGSRSTTSYSDSKALKNLKDVLLVSPIYSVSARIVYNSNNWQTVVMGTNKDYFELDSLEIDRGNIFTDDDTESGTTYAVIGKTVVQNLFQENEDPIGKTIRIKNVPFTVIGILKEKGSSSGKDADDVIISPIFAVKRRLTRNRFPDLVNIIMVKAISEKTLPFVEKRVETLLQERHSIPLDKENDFEIMNLKEIADKVSKIGIILSILLASIASISLFVGSIGIMNMMLVSVTERTREIGIRKAIGANDSDIMIQFLFESILIAIVGSIIGMLIGIIFSQIGGIILNKDVPISILTIIVSMVIAVIVGVASGIFPAMKATKLDPIEALRYQ